MSVQFADYENLANQANDIRQIEDSRQVGFGALWKISKPIIHLEVGQKTI